eukprot:gene3200-4352_t
MEDLMVAAPVAISTTSRRRVLIGATGLAAVGALGLPSLALSSAAVPLSGRNVGEGSVRTRDGTAIFYKDWGRGPVVLLSHGWPLNADAWEDQLFFLASNGCRVVAHDRRGHGRSSQSWNGNDIDTYADDLAAVIE